MWPRHNKRSSHSRNERDLLKEYKLLMDNPPHEPMVVDADQQEEDEQDEDDQISDEDDDDEIKDPEIDMAIAKHS